MGSLSPETMAAPAAYCTAILLNGWRCLLMMASEISIWILVVLRENWWECFWKPWTCLLGATLNDMNWSALVISVLHIASGLLACLLSFMLLDIEFKASVCWVVLYHWAVSPTFSLSLTSCGLTFDIPLQLRHCSLIFRMALGLSWFCFLFISVS